MNQLFQRLTVRKNRRRKTATVHVVVKTTLSSNNNKIWPKKFSSSNASSTSPSKTANSNINNNSNGANSSSDRSNKAPSLDTTAAETSFDHSTTTSTNTCTSSTATNPYLAYVNVPHPPPPRPPQLAQHMPSTTNESSSSTTGGGSFERSLKQPQQASSSSPLCSHDSDYYQNISKASSSTTTMITHQDEVEDDEYDSDGYHRYDDDESGRYVKCQILEDGDDGSSKNGRGTGDSTMRLALQASQRALLKNSESLVARTQRQRKVVASLDQSGNALYEQGKLEQAASKYQQALHMKRETLLLSNSNKKKNKSKNEATAPRTGDMVDTDDDGEQEQRAQTLASMATSINNLTYLKQVNGTANSQETLASYQTALQIKRDILGPTHLSVGKTLNNIGSVHYLAHDHVQAAEAYEQARDILRLHLGDEHLDVCTVTSNLGDVHACLGQYQRAVTEYRTAVKLRWKLLGRSDSRVVRLMEKIAELEMKINSNGEDDYDDENSASDDEDRDNANQLRAELQDDIHFFECLEHKAALDMIKDKTGVFKEMRELVANDNNDATKTTETSEPESVSPRRVACFPEKALASSDDCVSVSSPQIKQMTEESSNKASQLQPTIAAIATSPSTTLSAPVTDVAEKIQLSETSKFRSSSIFSDGPKLSTCSPPSQQSGSEQVIIPQPPTSPSRQYTSEERNKALESVKERVARLRAAREQRLSQSKTATPIMTTTTTTTYAAPRPSPMMMRSYMGPTQSSSAKTSPPRKFSFASTGVSSSAQHTLLKTSELFSMQEGINALRGFSNTNSSSGVAFNTRTSDATAMKTAAAVVSKRLFPPEPNRPTEKATPFRPPTYNFVDSQQ